MGKERDSNIESLRIIAMLMIVLHHLCLYGYQSGQMGVGAVDLARNLMLPGGKIGVDVFVLISGYFLASGKIKLASFLRVLLEAWFYALALGFLCAIVSPATFDLKVFLKSFLPTDGGLPWFVTAYLGMYLVAPWLAKLASCLEKSAFKQMLVVGFIVFSVVPTLLPGCKFVVSNFAWFCYLFLVACYIRKVGIGKKLARGFLIGGGCLLAASVLGMEVLATRVAVLQGREAYFGNMYMVPTAAASIGLFCIFKDLSLGSSKWINIAAKGTFGVYLIHENVFVRQLLWPHFDFVFNSGAVFVIPLALVSAIAVFAVFDVLDLMRLHALEKPFFAFLTRTCGQFFDRCDDVLNGRSGRELKS